MKIGYARTVEKQKAVVKLSITVQVIALVIAVVLSFTFAKIYFVFSILIGGICALIPNVVFAYFMFRFKGAQQAKKILSSFYFAEVIKFILVIGLLAVSYLYSNVLAWLKIPGILLGFIIVFISIMLVPIFTKDKSI